MTALKAKWSEMSRYRRVLLIVMAIEILAFFFATLVMIHRPGLEYQDALLYPRTEGELQIYQGRVDGETARFTVAPEWRSLLPVGGVHLRSLSDFRGPLRRPRTAMRAVSRH